MKAAVDQLKAEEGRRHINLTDKDAKLMKSRQGIVPGYNVQGMVSPLKTTETQKITGMIITAAGVISDTVDTNQLAPMMEQADENTDKKVEMTLADAGYHSGANLADCEQRKQKVAMPESQDRELQKPYHKDKFTYNPDTDSYACPHGQTLRFVRTKLARNTKMRIYHVSGTICRQCKAFGQCTTCSHHGRELQIGPNDAVLKRHRAWMATEEAKAIYSRRKELAEPTFGIIKEQMGFRTFLLRGLSNARAEVTLVVTAFNLRTLHHVWRAQLRKKRESLDTSLQNILENVAFWGLKGAQIV